MIERKRFIDVLYFAARAGKIYLQIPNKSANYKRKLNGKPYM